MNKETNIYNDDVMVEVGGSKSEVINVESDLCRSFFDITSNMDKRGFETITSGLGDGIVVIVFSNKEDVDNMMKEVLRYRDNVNGSRFVRETLWEFMEQECSFEIDYRNDIHDCNDGKGIHPSVRLTFPKEGIPRFNELFFEVFPKDKNIMYWKSLLDDIISNMNKRGFDPFCPDVDDEIVEIMFYSEDYVANMMKEVLRYDNKVNGWGFVRETLWGFMKEECSLEIDYNEDSEVDDVDGVISNEVRLTFPTEVLPRFKELFFEVFPEEKIQQVSNQ